jgi:hypothetical protein
MKKLLIIPAFFIITLFGFLFTMMLTVHVYQSHKETVHTVAQNQTIYAALPTAQNSFSTEIIATDGRTEAVRQFFARFNSPLEPYAADVVAAADQYKLDFRLIPAIAMQESNLCKKIPENSFNCWGYGIYGGKVLRFANYKEGIYTVSKSLGTKYKGNGLVTPAQIEQVYTPPSEGSWAYGVNHFMDQLE